MFDPSLLGSNNNNNNHVRPNVLGYGKMPDPSLLGSSNNVRLKRFWSGLDVTAMLHPRALGLAAIPDLNLLHLMVMPNPRALGLHCCQTQ